MPRTGGTATSQVYQITIPARQPMRMFISTQFNVTDSSGKTLEVNQPTVSEIVPSATGQIVVQLTVQ